MHTSFWAALSFTLLIIWVRPGPATLYGVDAGCYARVAAQIAAQPWQRWVDIRLGGDPFYEHPPGFVWLEAIAFRGLGDNTEAAVTLARIMATCALGLIVLVAYVVAGEHAALAALVALPTMNSFLFESQNPMLEMPLCVGLLLAMLGAWVLPQRGFWGVLAFALGSAVAFWAKGPPALAAGVWLAWASMRRHTPPMRVAAAAGLAVGMLVATVAAFEWQRAQLGLPAFFAAYVEHQVLASAVHGRSNPQSSLWYYLPVLWRWHATGVVLALPILVLLRRSAGRHRRAANLAEMGVVWGVVWWLGFSVMRQKYQWYMHPITPAFVWIMAAGAATIGRWHPGWRRVGLCAQYALPVAYGAMLICYPRPFRTPHRDLDAMHAAQRPVFAPNESRLVAYCGPQRWREEHVARFLWRAELTHCDDAAPFRFDGARLQRVATHER